MPRRAQYIVNMRKEHRKEEELLGRKELEHSLDLP